MIAVEVAFALPDKQKIVALNVPAGTTALEAAERSHIANDFPGLDVAASDMGIFGKAVKPAGHVLVEGDRVEIYRPLQVDPKASRKARAEKAAKKKGAE
ncbi:RnfH family protein [bacterium]|nr:RnfH family protein [bacterium]